MSFGDDVIEIESTSDSLDAFDGFIRAVRARLEAGREAYGDKSFRRAPVELLGELQQEALDLAGWGFVLWSRIEAMRIAAAPTLQGTMNPSDALGGAVFSLIHPRE